MSNTYWILQTYYYGTDQREHYGYARQFDTKEEAEHYARHNVTGHRHTILEYKKDLEGTA